MKKISQSKFISSAILAVLFIAAVFFALRYGSSYFTLKEFFCGLFKLDGYEKYSLILYGIRIPRVLGGVICGMGLSVSGCLLQQITLNDLAAPNIIGVNAGAGFFVIACLFFVPGIISVLPFAAFAGAFLATIIILSVAKAAGGGNSAVILSGIAFTAILNSAISFISLLDTDVLSSYNYFSVGGLSGISIRELIIPGIIVVLCLIITIAFSKKTEILCLGDDMAKAVGINVGLLRLLCLIIASFFAAAAVSIAGLLGFVGLIVPHIAKKISRGKMGIIIINCALCGGIVVVLADLAGRVLFAPTEIPVGIMMALTGAPFFLYLLLKKRGKPDA